MTRRSKRQRSLCVERVIDASAERIFKVLADANRHQEIDGSGTLTQLVAGDTPLTLGSTFSMRIRRGLTYTTKSRVVEFEANRLIAWSHWRKCIWRYELTARDDGTTLVRETFDWSQARWKRAIVIQGDHKKSVPAMEATLQKLALLFSSSRN